MANVLTFKFLRELQKKERSSSDLEKLETDFYSQISDYLKRKSSLNLSDDNDFSIRRDLEHTKVIIRDILNRRERKVMNLAMLNSRGDVVPKNMLPEEKAFFTDIKAALISYRESIDLMKSCGKNSKDDSKEGKKTSSDKDTPTKKDESGSQKDDISRIKMLDDMPKFMSDDGNEYGPFGKDDIVEIPCSAADILMNMEKAEKIE